MAYERAARLSEVHCDPCDKISANSSYSHPEVQLSGIKQRILLSDSTDSCTNDAVEMAIVPVGQSTSCIDGSFEGFDEIDRNVVLIDRCRKVLEDLVVKPIRHTRSMGPVPEMANVQTKILERASCKVVKSGRKKY